MHRPWIQAAIDVEDIDVAKQIAFMALDAGAEWLEVGTPLLYQYGHAAIRMIREAVGQNAILVADYKSPFGALCAMQAKREGADIVMLCAGYLDSSIEHSIQICKDAEITPIFDLCVHPSDMLHQTRRLVESGAKYLFTRHYMNVLDADGETHTFDMLTELNKGEKHYILGITSDNMEEALDAARNGADWITFGMVLRKPDQKICKTWIDAIHNAR